MEALETVFSEIRCNLKSLAAIQIDVREVESIEDGMPYFLATFCANLLTPLDSQSMLESLSYSTMRLMDCFKVRPATRLHTAEVAEISKQDTIAAIHTAANYVLRLISQQTHAQCSDQDVEIPKEFTQELQHAFETFWWAMDKRVRRVMVSDNILTLCNNLADSLKKPNA